jgi:hypothetical protein
MKKHLTHAALNLLTSSWTPIVLGSLIAAVIMVAMGIPANQITIAGLATGGAGGS